MSLDALEAVLRARTSAEPIDTWKIERNEDVAIVSAVTREDAATGQGAFDLASALLDELLAAGYVEGDNLHVAAIGKPRGDGVRWRGRLLVALVPR